MIVGPEQEERLRRNAMVVSSVPTADGTLFRVVAEAAALEGLAPQEVDPSLEDAYLHVMGEEALESEEATEAGVSA